MNPKRHYRRGVLLASSIALAAGTASVVLAQSNGRFFEKLDQNKDGVISQEEMRAMEQRRFQRLDTDGDGSISQEELAERSRKRFQRVDANGDGQVSQEEFQTAKKRWHDKRKSD